MEIKLEHNKVKLATTGSHPTTKIGAVVNIAAPTNPGHRSLREPQAVVFVIDRSGSMSGHPLEMVAKTILGNLEILNENDMVSLVTFDDSVRVELPMSPMTNVNRALLTASIGRLVSGGSTNIEMGYRIGLAEASKVSEGMPTRLILLSDGHANIGSVNAEEFKALAQFANLNGVTSSAIGIGVGYDERLLAAIADGGSGNHIAGIELAEAAAGLKDELNAAFNRYYTDVKVSFEFDSTAFAASTSVRHLSWVRAVNVEGNLFTLDDLTAGDDKSWVFELGLVPDPNIARAWNQQGELRGVITAVEYATGIEVREEFVLGFDFVNEADWVAPQVDPDVEAELRAAQLAEVRAKVHALYEAERFDEADAILREHGKSLQEYIDLGILSSRASSRMQSQVDDLMYMSMAPALEKSKRMYESVNRAQRGRRNFRDDNR